MADDKAETRQKQQPKKQGLHGWKAATAVFGCGTLAAFGIFGSLFGVASFFLESASSGLGNTPGDVVVDQTGSPVSHLEPGEMNLCLDDVQYAYGSPDPDYSSGNYEDPALHGEEKDRTVKDECHWKINPNRSGGSQVEPWDLVYSYEAVISHSGESSPEDIAEQRFDELVRDLGSEGSEILSSGEADLSEQAYYYYGRSNEGGYFYSLIGRTRSTVYVMEFSSPAGNGDVTEIRFLNEARHVASFFETSLKVLVPE